MPQADITAVLEKFSDLTAYGAGIYEPHRLSPEEQKAKLKEGQEQLLQDVATFDKVVAWLSAHPEARIKTINRGRSSYGWKHVAERAIGTYVSNGIFIAAAVHLGYPYHRTFGNPNVSFPLSEKFYAAMEAQMSER